MKREKPIDADLKAIARLKMLSWVPTERLEHLSRQAELIRIGRSETIFSQGEPATRMYLMLAGVARMSIESDEGRVLVGLIAPGEIFGASSLLPHAKRPFRCEAFTDCTVAAVTPEAFVSAALGIQVTNLERMLEVTIGRWFTMLIRYANFVGCGLRGRLASVLCELGGKFGVRDARGILLTLKVRHEDLADLVGASRQRITIQLRELEREQSLIRDGRRMIIIPEKLMGGGQLALLAGEFSKETIPDASRQIRNSKRSQTSLPRPRGGR